MVLGTFRLSTYCAHASRHSCHHWVLQSVHFICHGLNETLEVNAMLLGAYTVVRNSSGHAIDSVLNSTQAYDQREDSQIEQQVHMIDLIQVQVVTVAFHESGHALAGLATCAHITSVEIDPELGGLTQMRGGIQWITLPAGTQLTSSFLHSAISALCAPGSPP